MKKILISILIVLLLILTYFALAKGIKVLNIKSINNIKEANNRLETDFNKSNELSNKTYPSQVQELEDTIKKLKIAKQDYENKKLYIQEENSVGTLEIKTYKIHYLWTILGNYRKDRGVKALTLDLKSTENNNVYDLEFTLNGTYTSITDFLYDIENDEELNFEIKNFEISSSINNETNTQDESGQEIDNQDANNQDTNNQDTNNQDTNNNQQANQQQNSTEEKKQEDEKQNETQPDGINLQAKFTVEDIGITLD